MKGVTIMKQKIGFAIGMLLIVTLIFSSPWADNRQSSGLTNLMRYWGKQQQNTSEVITNSAVEGAEGNWVGEHEINGANWAIPNIIRHWLGVK